MTTVASAAALQKPGAPEEPVPGLDLSPLKVINESDSRGQSYAWHGDEEAARALYESELRKNKQLKKLLADQGAMLAAAPTTSSQGKALEENGDGSAKRST